LPADSFLQKSLPVLSTYPIAIFAEENEKIICASGFVLAKQNSLQSRVIIWF